MSKIHELKELIKTKATEQRSLRPQRKCSYTGVRTHRAPHPWERPFEACQNQMRDNKRELRHLHLAYCTLRNTPIELAEAKHKKGKLGPDMAIVKFMVARFSDESA